MQTWYCSIEILNISILLCESVDALVFLPTSLTHAHHLLAGFFSLLLLISLHLLSRKCGNNVQTQDRGPDPSYKTGTPTPNLHSTLYWEKYIYLFFFILKKCVNCSGVKLEKSVCEKSTLRRKMCIQTFFILCNPMGPVELF